MKTIKDVKDISDQICRLFEPLAKKGVRPRLENEFGIQVLIGRGKNEGTVQYDFITVDNLHIIVPVDFNEVYKDHKTYFSGMLDQVWAELNEKRRETQRKRYVLPVTSPSVIEKIKKVSQ